MDNKGRNFEEVYGKGKRYESLHSGENMGPPFRTHDDDPLKLASEKPSGKEFDSSSTAYFKNLWPELFEEFSWRLLARFFVKSLIALLLLFAFWLLCQIFNYFFPAASS